MEEEEGESLLMSKGKEARQGMKYPENWLAEINLINTRVSRGNPTKSDTP